MVQKPESITLPIPIKIVEYKHFIEQCCDFVFDVESLGDDFNKCAKFKLVIMELLTNAIKHSKTLSYLEIIKARDKLIVRKIDEGSRFLFKDIFSNELIEFPLTVFDGEMKLTALLGNNYELPLLLRSKNSVEFLLPEEVEFDSIFSIPENFGLLIIKKCSDYFYYHFDEENNRNIFEVVFNF